MPSFSLAAYLTRENGSEYFQSRVLVTLIRRKENRLAKKADTSALSEIISAWLNNAPVNGEFSVGKSLFK